MPQIGKGAKWVFGWSRVCNGRVILPPQACQEYGLHPGQNVILLSGSRTSGGFGVSTSALLAGSPLSRVLDRHPRLARYEIPAGSPVQHGGRTYCWLQLCDGTALVLSPEARDAFGVREGDLLLSVRGSGIALGFSARGPLVARARGHPGIPVFEG